VASSVAATLLLALLVVPASANAQQAGGKGCPPAPQTATSVGPSTPSSVPVPASGQIVVCVGPTAITGALYSHWLTIAEKSTAGMQPAARTLENQVLSFLISSDWIRGEAVDRRIGVSVKKVRRTFDRLRREEFTKRGEFKAFLRSSGQTIADLLMRVELNLLSQRIEQQVQAGHHGASAKRRALSRFVAVFKGKWMAQTYCAAEFDEEHDCGHVQSTL
jgi:hypothetical protein